MCMRAIRSGSQNAINELLNLPLDPQSQADAHALQADAERVWQELKSAPPNSPRLAELINSYPQMADLAIQNIESRQRADRPRTDEPAAGGAARAAESVLADAAAGADDPCGGRRVHLPVRQTHPRHRPRDQRARAAAPSPGRSPFAGRPTWSAWRRNWSGCASDYWILRRKRIDSCDTCRMN